jgi:hypothetical protein
MPASKGSRVPVFALASYAAAGRVKGSGFRGSKVQGSEVQKFSVHNVSEPHMKLHLAGTVKRLNVRCSFVSRPIKLATAETSGGAEP